jgi:hypothetical protein
MSSALRTYSVNVPYSDQNFFDTLAGKMGWTINERIEEPSQTTEKELRCEVMQSVADAERGLGITLSEALKSAVLSSREDIRNSRVVTIEEMRRKHPRI